MVASLALPAAALAGKTGDGSLDVAGASGSVSLTGKGVVFGHVARGAITILSYKADGNAVPTVSGAKMKLSSDASSVVYSGTDMRFLLPGGRYTLQIDGSGIDVSAVGKGSVSGLGAGTLTADTVVLALGNVPTGASWGK